MQEFLEITLRGDAIERVLPHAFKLNDQRNNDYMQQGNNSQNISSAVNTNILKSVTIECG